MSCRSCCERLAYCAEVLGCPDSLTLKVGLAPGAPYYLWIEDMFGNIYGGQVVAGQDGSLTMNAEALDLPEHLLHPVGAPLYVWVTPSENHTESPVTLNLPAQDCDEEAATTTYNSIFLNFAAGPASTVVG